MIIEAMDVSCGRVSVRVVALILCWCAFAQQNPPDEKREPLTTFQSKVNLVLVPVVVRDAQGHSIGNLRKDDFQLLDSRRPQIISSFSAVDRATLASPGVDERPHSIPQAPTLQPEQNRPNRYLVYLFDDLNSRFEDIAHVRDAALRHFNKPVLPGDLMAVYALSGKPALDFSADRDKLRDAVSSLRWRPQAGHGGMQCPDVSFYIADLVINKGDAQALEALTDHTAECTHVPSRAMARNIALAAANQRLVVGALDTQLALAMVLRAIQRLSRVPGERVIVLASPGFYGQTPAAIKATAEVLDLAAKSNVVVSGLNPRGVIQAEEDEDVTSRAGGGRRTRPGEPLPLSAWIRYRRESARAEGDAVKDLVDATGGLLFQNNNDLVAGFDRISTAPEFSYVLGFSPADLKTDGTFHPLKIRVNRKGVTIEARRGFYALSANATEEWSTAEALDTLFSRDEKTDIPVVVVSGYSKPKTGDTAKIQLTAKIDVAALHFHKSDDRNRDSLRAIVAVFDADGTYVTGTAENLKLSLPDDLLTSNDPSVTVHWDFEVKPGTYAVRLVIREIDTKIITTLTRSVIIPL